MITEKENVELSEIIDVNFMQQLQDTFAQTIGIASITVDLKKPITKASNFTEFCSKYIRTSSFGLKRCNECDIKWGQYAAIRKEPVIYTCHSGLTDFAVPIIINNKHIGSILGGQVFSEPPNEENIKKLAQELDVNEEELIEASKKVRILSKEKIELAAKLLFLVANTVSEVGMKNLELLEKNNKEKLIREISEAIRNSLDLKETKQTIISLIGKKLNADRCMLVEYNDETDKFGVVEDEYTSSPEIIKYKGTDINENVPIFAKVLKLGKYLLINDKEIFMDYEAEDLELEKIAIEQNHVTSAIAVPLIFKKKLIGAFSIHYVNQTRIITQSDADLIKILANQIALAIYQAKQYQIIETQAEILRVQKIITEVLRSTIETSIIKNQFVKIIGKYFQADRVFYSEYDQKQSMYLPVEADSEYLSTPNEKSFVGYDWSDPKIIEYIQPMIERREFNIPNWEEYIRQHPKSKDFIFLFEDASVKSSYNFPVFYQGDLLGYFCIEFTKEVKVLTENEINLIRNICSQTGVALHHSYLYEKIKNTLNKKDIYIQNMSVELKNQIKTAKSIVQKLVQTQMESEERERYVNKLHEICTTVTSITDRII